MKILMLHGINHTMFGKRDPAQYGTVTLEQINASLNARGKDLGASVETFQTNSEGAMCFGADGYLLALRAAVSVAKAANTLKAARP